MLLQTECMRRTKSGWPTWWRLATISRQQLKLAKLFNVVGRNRNQTVMRKLIGFKNVSIVCDVTFTFFSIWIVALAKLKPRWLCQEIACLRAVWQHSNVFWNLLQFILTVASVWLCLQCFDARCWLGDRKGIRPVKNWVVGYWRGYLSGATCRLHMAQLMPLPLTVSCFNKIQIGSTFLVPAHPGSPGKRAIKRVCVCVASVW